MGGELGLLPLQAAQAASSSTDAKWSPASFLQDHGCGRPLLRAQRRAQLGTGTPATSQKQSVAQVSIKCRGQDRAENPAGAVQGQMSPADSTTKATAEW